MFSRAASRTPLLWFVFALTALAAGAAVHRLYETARREIVEQSERTLTQERARMQARIRATTDEARRAVIVDLASLHVDGLGQSLRKWDDASGDIVGVFIWDAARGFSPASRFPAGVRAEELEQLWREFRGWRADHPAARTREGVDVGPFQTLAHATVDNPAIPAAELRYQSENLEILAHAGRAVDAWAGWAGAADDAGAPWIFWYQAGPDDAVRGCFVDVKPIVGRLRAQRPDTSYARVELVPAPAPTSAPVADVVEVHVFAGALGGPAYIDRASGLPAYAVTIDHGELFRAKDGAARLTAVGAGALLALFILGGAALTAHTRRGRREAERKITFVAQVSHELRTPLTSIRMYADLLATPELAETKRLKFAGTIRRESERLEGLVERLLALNELERGGKTVACGPIDVVALVRETVEEMGAALGEAGLVVETDLPATPEEVVVRSHGSTLKQALINLLDNAKKYARGGGPVRLSVANASDHVRVDVVDQGPGIPRAIRDRLFEPFIQGGQTITDKSPGVGLGLSLARGTLRRIGADLVLLDTERGAAFRIRLPKTAGPAAADPAVAPAAVSP